MHYLSERWEPKSICQGVTHLRHKSHVFLFLLLGFLSLPWDRLFQRLHIVQFKQKCLICRWMESARGLKKLNFTLLINLLGKLVSNAISCKYLVLTQVFIYVRRGTSQIDINMCLNNPSLADQMSKMLRDQKHFRQITSDLWKPKLLYPPMTRRIQCHVPPLERFLVCKNGKQLNPTTSFIAPSSGNDFLSRFQLHSPKCNTNRRNELRISG